MGKKIFICKNCGEEYYSYKDKSDFCSKKCKHDYYHIPHICDYCKKEHFVTRDKYEKLLNGDRKHLYCSKECANKGLITSTNKICKCCGKIFPIENSVKDIQVFCSQDCYHEYKRRHSKKSIKICPVCNKTFETYHHNQVYCDRRCQGIASRNRKICICDFCGTEFERIESEVKKTNKHFCSAECRYEYFRWNEQDIQILKDNYNKISLDDIKKLLSKEYTKSAIKSKAGVLGLYKSRLWTKEEEIILFKNYSKLPMNKLLKLLPNRTFASVMGKARVNNLLSYFYLNNVYSVDDIKYLTDNYLIKTNEELAENLGRNAYGIEQKLRNLGLNRPYEIKKDGYLKLENFIRSRLYTWKNEVRKMNNYTCSVTDSRSNIIVHHCRSFNLLMQENIENTNFKIKDNFSDYTDEELNLFLNNFLDLQAYYGEYVCVTESVHRLFHNEYGYGDNTIEQWNEFVGKYKNGYYDNIV